MFVATESTIPQRLAFADFIIRPLLISDVVKDYDAVMSSKDRLQGLDGRGLAISAVASPGRGDDFGG